MEDTTGARSVKRKCPFPALDGPPMSVEDWATMVFEVETKTILEWVKDHNIRHKRFGRTSMIKPVDMWECVPYSNEMPEPEAEQLQNPKRKR